MMPSVSIQIGETCRVSRAIPAVTGMVDYLALTAGATGVPADPQKGIFAYRDVRGRGDDIARVPAIILHTNPLKTDPAINPWADIVDPDGGYALFHGDNKRPGVTAHSARGNARIISVWPLYSQPELRKYAPPVLLFEQVEHHGVRKGFRVFVGFGVPTGMRLITQKGDAGAYFSNIAIELTLFHLDPEGNALDWRWIDARRDGARSSDETLKYAPAAWREWVSNGDSALERCRRRVHSRRILPRDEQLSMSTLEREVLAQVVSYYAGRQHIFESLASFITGEIMGRGYRRGWVTSQSADGGYDFVSRVDFGDERPTASRAPVVVLGQAKCTAVDTSVGGHALARLVARLQRGWLGAFVTTGWFTIAAQRELLADRYPVLLINGRRVAEALLTSSKRQGAAVAAILEREATWYENNRSRLPAERILDW
jgi:hypothetical protein